MYGLRYGLAKQGNWSATLGDRRGRASSRRRSQCGGQAVTSLLALKHSRNVLLTVSHELGREGNVVLAPPSQSARLSGAMVSPIGQGAT